MNYGKERTASRKSGEFRTQASRAFALLLGCSIAALLSTCVTSKIQDSAISEIKEDHMSASTNVLVMAHRGFRGIAPENTLLAAQKGYETGADFWELDVAASSDGELIIMHDDNLVRTTDAEERFPSRKPWSVYDFTLAELKSLDAGSWYGKADQFGQIVAGRVTAKDLDSFTGLRIPTLAEALKLTKKNGWKVNIEIKDATGRACDPWIVEKTAESVRAMGMAESVIVSSFNHAYLVRMKKAAPEIRVAALIDRPIPDPVATLKRIGAMALNPNGRYLDEDTVKKVRSAGFDVFAWTTNEKSAMEKLVKWGVSGLITDFPDRALAVLGRPVGR